jgi:hypothetical protein
MKHKTLQELERADNIKAFCLIAIAFILPLALLFSLPYLHLFIN